MALQHLFVRLSNNGMNLLFGAGVEAKTFEVVLFNPSACASPARLALLNVFTPDCVKICDNRASQSFIFGMPGNRLAWLAGGTLTWKYAALKKN